MTFSCSQAAYKHLHKVSAPIKAVTALVDHHTCQPIQFTGIKFKKIIILGGYGHIGKWIQENIIFMRFCCCFKQSKKIEKLSNEQLMHTIAKCTQIGLVQ